MMVESKVKVSESSEHFLLQIEPHSDSSMKLLKNWVKENHTFLLNKMAEYGGIYFKGFNINSAEDFENIALLIDSNLCDKHPFNGDARTWVTKYTYEVASPDIKQSLTPRAFHNEDSFTSSVPTTIMFFSLEPAAFGGETLLADCRKVFDSLPEKLKQKFINKSVESKMVLHDDVFLINSRIPKITDVIIKTGKEYGAESTLRLSENTTQFSFKMPLVVKVESSDKPVWLNLLHLSLLFSYQLYVDTWFAYAYRGGFLNKIRACGLILNAFFEDLKMIIRSAIKKEKSDEYDLIGNDKVSVLERIKINLAYWKNSAVFPLKKGDFVVLDNRLVAHARMPYIGRRVLLSCMGSLTNPKSFYKKNE